jgi:hypothetical protein
MVKAIIVLKSLLNISMKKFPILIFLSLFLIQVNGQVAYRMQLLSNWNNPNLNKVDSINIWNDLIKSSDCSKQ